jgi:aldose 1-epimerase
MLGASLCHRGVELLRRVEDLDGAATKGSTAGIPLLHPWANRLGGPGYRVAGRSVALDPASPLLHIDEHGLPIHGVPWAHLAWEVTATPPDALRAHLDWNRRDLLTVFPYPHRIELAVTLRPDGLTLETALEAGAEGPVPVSFGFHPYLGLSDLRRVHWRLELPAMRKLELDERGIPTGEETSFAGFHAELGEVGFDDGFALVDERSIFALSGAGRRLSVELLGGYTHAQVFAPPDRDYIALEPMTAPTAALTSGRGLRLVQPRGRFLAAFRIGIAEI